MLWLDWQVINSRAFIKAQKLAQIATFATPLLVIDATITTFHSCHINTDATLATVTTVVTVATVVTPAILATLVTVAEVTSLATVTTFAVLMLHRPSWVIYEPLCVMRCSITLLR